MTCKKQQLQGVWPGQFNSMSTANAAAAQPSEQLSVTLTHLNGTPHVVGRLIWGTQAAAAAMAMAAIGTPLVHCVTSPTASDWLAQVIAD